MMTLCMGMAKKMGIGLNAFLLSFPSVYAGEKEDCLKDKSSTWV